MGTSIATILERHPVLLRDMCTFDAAGPVGGNIRLCTCDYSEHQFGEEITPELASTFVPRWEKSKAAQRARTKSKAEVFTPTALIAHILELTVRECGEDIYSPNRTFCEPCCGEGAFLLTRRDQDTGAPIDVPNRVGVLDRKLLNIDTADEAAWKTIALKCLASVYGYEYQGDSLVLARVNTYLTMTEHAAYRGYTWSETELDIIAETIARHIWQVDGTTNRPPWRTTDEDVWTVVWQGDKTVVYDPSPDVARATRDKLAGRRPARKTRRRKTAKTTAKTTAKKTTTAA